METMKKQTCETCQYWEAGELMGECRLNPPQVIIWSEDNLPMHKTVWPITNALEWCGWFEEKKWKPLFFRL
jgi:hypothetical protein